MAQLEALHVTELWQLLAPLQVVLVHAAREQLQQLVHRAILCVGLQLEESESVTRTGHSVQNIRMASSKTDDDDDDDDLGFWGARTDNVIGDPARRFSPYVFRFFYADAKFDRQCLFQSPLSQQWQVQLPPSLDRWLNRGPGLVLSIDVLFQVFFFIQMLHMTKSVFHALTHEVVSS